MFEKELMHLHMALSLLREYEKKDWYDVIPDAFFPAPLRLESNIGYVRKILGGWQSNQTAVREDYARRAPKMDGLDTFADYQKQVNRPHSRM